MFLLGSWYVLAKFCYILAKLFLYHCKVIARSLLVYC